MLEKDRKSLTKKKKKRVRKKNRKIKTVSTKGRERRKENGLCSDKHYPVLLSRISVVLNYG